MKPRSLDPRRLDLPRFAAAGASLAGEWPAGALPRLVADAPLAGGRPVAWSAAGERRAQTAHAPQDWLHLQARAEVVVTCQRCLQPMTKPLAIDRWLRFVADEAEAERLDEASDDDVLALPARGGIDLCALLEDELILALPLVPQHARCPQPLVPPAAAADEAPAPPPVTEPAPHPFAALAGLAGRARKDPAGG